jgi:LysM repeat protein
VTVLAAAVLSLALAAGTAAGSEAQGSARPPAGVSRLVRPGDTLWEIARSRVGPEGDPRPLVEAIRRINQLGTGSVQAGQVLLVPPVT